MKKILQYLALVLLTAVSFLFSPRPANNVGPDKDCPVNYIQLNRYMGFSMNCDAIEFMGGSVNPGYLFQKNYSRQSRPLYLLAGAAAGYTVYFLSTPFHQAINKAAGSWFNNQVPENEVALYLSHYAGLILINLIILVISLLLFEKIIRFATGSMKNGQYLNFALLLFLVSNHTTKTFFWTPHQQMFNTLLPILCVWLFIRIINREYTARGLTVLGFLNGILVLLYGSFLLLLPVLLIAVIYRQVKISRQPVTKIIAPLLLAALAFCLPLLTWIIILQTTGTGFYSHETYYFREFIWVIDTLKDPQRNLIYELGTNVLTYLKTSAILLPSVIFCMGSYLLTRDQPATTEKSNFKTLQNVIIFNAFLILLFFFFLGYYTDRLTYSLSPLFILFGAALLNKNRLTRIKISGIILFILLWHGFILLKEMPHFSTRFYH